MINAIIKKEWIKTRFIVLILLLTSIGIFSLFWYNINFLFSTIEPESMMWYRYCTLEEKPYESFAYFYYAIGATMAIFQFIPERVRNRIRIMTHLPISLQKSLFLHLFIGLFFLFILSLIITFIIVIVIYQYYPMQIVLTTFKDCCFYFLGSILMYLSVSSVIIEKNSFMSIAKLFMGILFIYVFHKNTFSNMDLIWIPISGVMLFIVLDSFYSTKQQRLESFIFKFFVFLSVLVVAFFSYTLYFGKYKYDFSKYYIFYSPIVKTFVYQKNYGDHRFEYGIKNKKTFDRLEYESYLPFVYWKNLDIQNLLPIKIDNELFDKKRIKESRLSFSYNPNLLKKQEVQMYPFINTKSKNGTIKFPEEVISLNNNGINIYNFDDGLDKDITNELKNLLHIKNVSFPIKNIWGKATNMKPFDLGYFFLDSNEKLFRVNRDDNKVYLDEIKYPKDMKIKFIKISENKKREMAGFAIDSKNNIHIIDYKTFEFKKIELNNFNYKKMKLLFISNPKYYLIRYTNEDKYYGVVLDKNFKKLDEVIFE